LFAPQTAAAAAMTIKNRLAQLMELAKVTQTNQFIGFGSVGFANL